MTEALVAEITPRADASPEDLRRLGFLLRACLQEHAWIAQIAGLQELLDGRLPARMSSAPMFVRRGEPISFPTETCVLIWAKVPCPVPGQIDPQSILRAAIPADLAFVAPPTNYY